jgi:poly(3-hydroxybutyrate) depolymerase
MILEVSMREVRLRIEAEARAAVAEARAAAAEERAAKAEARAAEASMAAAELRASQVELLARALNAEAALKDSLSRAPEEATPAGPTLEPIPGSTPEQEAARQAVHEVMFHSTGYKAASKNRCNRSCRDPRVQHETYALPATNEPMPYAYFAPSELPSDPKKAEPMPLLVLLHGFGSEYDSMLSAKFDGILEAAECLKMFLASPLGYHRAAWYGSRTKQIMGSRDIEIESQYSEQDVMEVVARMQASYNIDPERIFLCGHSMGGAGALHLAIKYPKQWAAVALFAPAVPGGKVKVDETAYTYTKDDLKVIEAPLFVVAGRDDRFGVLEPIRGWVARMKECGLRHDFVEVGGGGHEDILRSQLGRMVDFLTSGRLNPVSNTIVIERPAPPPESVSPAGEPTTEAASDKSQTDTVSAVEEAPTKEEKAPAKTPATAVPAAPAPAPAEAEVVSLEGAPAQSESPPPPASAPAEAEPVVAPLEGAPAEAADRGRRRGVVHRQTHVPSRWELRQRGSVASR